MKTVEQRIFFCKGRIESLKLYIERNSDIKKMNYFYTDEEIKNNKCEVTVKDILLLMEKEREYLNILLKQEEDLLSNLLKQK